MPKGKLKLIGIGLADTKHKCLHCDYQVGSITGIKLHLKKTHGFREIVDGEENKKCYACKKDFADEKQFLKHMKKEHY